jgi:hypothetical protein
LGEEMKNGKMVLPVEKKRLSIVAHICNSCYSENIDGRIAVQGLSENQTKKRAGGVGPEFKSQSCHSLNTYKIVEKKNKPVKYQCI